MKKFTLLIVLFIFAGTQLFAQTTVTGVVTEDETGDPIPGANVVIKGTTTGTITDLDGQYSINVPEGKTTLIFSFVGLKSTEEEIGSRTTINIALKSDTDIEEVVVTAVGVSRSEKKIGYAVTTVAGEELTKDKSRSMLNALQGKVAGVNISSASGAPGASTRVVIRGFTTINGGSQPLYVIDGVPMNNDASGSGSLNGGTDFGNSANDVNPEDIASMTILKGSAATALYGSRASNGVIIITTKKGKGNKGGLEVSISSTVKFSTPLRLPQLQNVYGQGIFGNWDQRENTSYGPKFDDEMRYWGHVVNNKRLIKPYSALPNNVADFFEIGRTFQNSVAITGGDETNSYYLSFSNVDDDGIMPYDYDSYKRNTVSFRGSTKLSNKITSSASVNYVNKKNKFVPTGQGGQSVWNNVLQQPRDVPISELANYKEPFYDINSYYGEYTTNPYWPLNENGNNNNEDRFYGMVSTNYIPNDNWIIQFRAGTDVSARQLTEWRAVKINDPNGPNAGTDDEFGMFDEYRRWISQFNTDFIVTYNNQFGDFGVNLLAGHNLNQNKRNTLYGEVVDLDLEGFQHISNSPNITSLSQATTIKRIIGAYANAEVNYKGWLNLAGSFRNDWSSTLPTEYNSFYYPSVMLGFVYSDAIPAIKKYIPYGKLRASWGQTGLDADPYQVYSTLYRPSAFPLPNSEINAFSVGNLIGNPNLQPEISTEIEIGTDMRFLNNRVSIDFTYYDKTTTDLIHTVEYAYSSGYSAQTLNLGEINNKGYEFLLNLTPIKKKNFQWDITYTYTKNKSLLVSLNEELGLDEITVNGLIGGSTSLFKLIPGQPIGVFETTKPKTWTDASGVEHIVVNSSGVPDNELDELEYSGTSEYDFMMGLTNSFTIYGVKVSCLIDYRKGGVMYSRTAGMVYFTGIAPQTLYNDRQPFIVPNSVIEDGEIDGVTQYKENTRPVLYSDLGGSANSYMDVGGTAVGEHEIIDKGFIKLRSLSISYAMPKKIMDKTPVIGSAQFSIVGNNLLLFTPGTDGKLANNMIDPEATTFGNNALEAEFGEFGASPSIRSVGFNVSFTF